MATKLVNGERFDMTPEEEQAHQDSHPGIREPAEPLATDIIFEALKAKNVLTKGDLTAARKRLRQ